MNAWAVFAAMFGLTALSVLVLILAARGRDTKWAHRRELRRWVTPHYIPTPPDTGYDEYGRPG